MHWKILCALVICAIASISEADDTAVLQSLITREIAKSHRYRFPKDAKQYQTRNRQPRDFGLFDFIVIGGGSAGSVIANRLTENSTWRVLLLEAGKDENNFTAIPVMTPYTRNSEYNWGFNSTMKTTCCLETNGICSYPRGKGLGGSSIINYLIYSRGNSDDYDNWASQGNPGWAYADVLPYFIKSENSQIVGDRGFHGRGGPLNVAYHRPVSPHTLAFLNASYQVGAPILDYNGRSQFGASLMQLNTINGTRDSSNNAFLRPVRSRRTLTVSTQSYVTQIVFANSTRRVQSVIFSLNNIRYVARVRREVILAAGVIGSPHLLMVSGIGPRNELRSYNISVVRNLPVGQTLYDHSSFRSFMVLTNQSQIFPSLTQSVRQYLTTGTGRLTISQNAEGIAFFNAGESPNSEIEFILSSSINYASEYDRQHTSVLGNFRDSWNIDPLNSTDIENRVMIISSILMRAQSQGSVTLQSNDPFIYPLIDFPCLEDPENEDLQYMFRAIRTAEMLLQTPAFRAISARYLVYKPCANNPIGSRAYWVCCLRQSTVTLYHGVGTCKMAPQNMSGVVDNRLKVYGIPNLRVADASVIPFNLACHTNAPAMMIGERVSDFIKEDYPQ